VDVFQGFGVILRLLAWPLQLSYHGKERPAQRGCFGYGNLCGMPRLRQGAALRLAADEDCRPSGGERPGRGSGNQRACISFVDGLSGIAKGGTSVPPFAFGCCLLVAVVGAALQGRTAVV